MLVGFRSRWPHPPCKRDRMEISDLRKLVQLMLRADLSELELDDSNRGLRVHLKRPSQKAETAPSVVQVLPTAMAGPLAAPLAAPMPAAAPAAGAPAPAGPPEGTEVFKSPIVGTFYRSPSPEAESFVSPGTRFDENTVLCIIEAMKVMNEIRAEFRGEIVEVLAENAEPVEFGQPLFLVKKG
jgi:acetyl-CoA carboxylase biotin carboxyl carrier protein